MPALSMTVRLKRHKRVAKYLDKLLGEIPSIEYTLMRLVEEHTRKSSILRGLSRTRYPELRLRQKLILLLPKNISPELALSIRDALKEKHQLEADPMKLLRYHAADRLEPLIRTAASR